MEIAIWFQVAKQKEKKENAFTVLYFWKASISIRVSQSMDIAAQNVTLGFLPRDVENTPSYFSRFRCYSNLILTKQHNILMTDVTHLFAIFESSLLNLLLMLVYAETPRHH